MLFVFEFAYLLWWNLEIDKLKSDMMESINKYFKKLFIISIKTKLYKL